MLYGCSVDLLDSSLTAHKLTHKGAVGEMFTRKEKGTLIRGPLIGDREVGFLALVDEVSPFCSELSRSSIYGRAKKRGHSFYEWPRRQHRSGAFKVGGSRITLNPC